MDIQFIRVNEITKYIKDERVTFIDLRERSDYGKRHIKGARSIPYEEFLMQYKTLPKNRLYVLYCDKGATSILAAASMQQAGYRVRSLAGGMQAAALNRQTPCE